MPFSVAADLSLLQNQDQFKEDFLTHRSSMMLLDEDASLIRFEENRGAPGFRPENQSLIIPTNNEFLTSDQSQKYDNSEITKIE